MKITNEILEVVADHLGFDLDELEPHSAGAKSFESITTQWHDKVRDLSHLDRAARQSVLQNRTPIDPLVIDGCEVRLYEEVQAYKGDQRKSVAIVDVGGERIIFSGC